MIFRISSVLFVLLVPLVSPKTDSSTIAGRLETSKQTISLAKCCPEDEFYMIGFDKCKSGEGLEINAEWPPPIFPVAANRTVTAKSRAISVTVHLADCPLNFVTLSSIDFMLFDDGTINVPGHGKFEVGKFCVSQIRADGLSKPTFAARFCVPDPCTDDAVCIRKCCPSGMIFNSTQRTCQPSSLPFEVNFHDESANLLNTSDVSYVVRDGSVPKCEHGFGRMGKRHEEEFYVLPNGSIFTLESPPDEREFCMDNFFRDDSTEMEALVCFDPEAKESTEDVIALSIIPYFLIVSSIFLILTVLVYAIIPQIRNINGVSIMAHAVSLATFYIILVAIQLNPSMVHMPKLCSILPIFGHFAFLANFAWINVMSYDILRTFSDLRPTRNRLGSRPHLGLRFLFYSIYAWGVPLVIVVVGQILEHTKGLPNHITKPGFGKESCWFSSELGYTVYMYGPAAVLILVNFIFFAATIFLLHRASADTSLAAGSRRAKQKFRVVFSLGLLMGLNWLTEIISHFAGGKPTEWLFTDILNILTGVVIFFLMVCKPNVWKLLKEKIPPLEKLDPCCPAFMKTGVSRSTSARTGSTSSTKSKSKWSSGKYSRARKESTSTVASKFVSETSHNDGDVKSSVFSD